MYKLLSLLLASAFLAASAKADSGVTITLQKADGTALRAKSDPQAVKLDYGAAYQTGDTIVVSGGGKYFFVQVDAAVPESLVYAPGGKITFPIPNGPELKMGYDHKAFAGEAHVIKARLATAADLSAERNVALNAVDKRGQSEFFPHATANIVTRNEPDFYERNAIDGNSNNAHHGPWPYESWSGGAREDLNFKIDFGREVEIDKVRLFMRCDFPHDTYWKSLTVHFSDGSQMDVNLDMKRDPQEFPFPAKKVTWIQLDNFKQAATPLTWAGLTEIEVMGHDTNTQP